MLFSNESFEDYLKRIDSFQPLSFRKGAVSFALNTDVREKVDVNGNFKPFFGDTVIFDLDYEEKRYLDNFRNDIYEIAGDYLAEKLDSETFHMTLHDLSVFPGDIPAESMPYYQKVCELVSEMNSDSLEKWPYTVDMEPKWIFNMNNTSIVVGLRAGCEEDHNRLMALYRAFDEIVSSPHPYTPHFTLAYFKSDVPTETMLKLAKYTERKYGERFFMTRKRKELRYCRFTSMNNYERIV